MLIIPSLTRKQTVLIADAVAGGLAVMQPHAKEGTPRQAHGPW